MCGKIGVGSDNGVKTLVPAMAGMKFLGRAEGISDTIKAVDATTDAAKSTDTLKTVLTRRTTH